MFTPAIRATLKPHIIALFEGLSHFRDITFFWVQERDATNTIWAKCAQGFVFALLFALSSQAFSLDTVSWRLNGKVVEKTGRILVEAQDGGLVLQTPDAQIWSISPDVQVSKSSNTDPFVPISLDEMIESLKQELPADFKYQKTDHYVIAYNTKDVYAEWSGDLFERLFKASEA